MSKRVFDFSLATTDLISNFLRKRIKCYNSPTQIATERVAKENSVKKSDKDRYDTKGFRYVVREGRMCRMKVGKDEKEFKTDGVNSFKSLNKHKLRIGTRPQRYRISPEPALTFFNQNKEYFAENEVDLNKFLVVDGCFDTNRTILQRTATPEDVNDECIELPNLSNLNILKKSIKATIRKIKIELISSPTFSQALMCKFSKDTKPGFSAEHVLGHKNKTAAVQDSVSAAKVIWNNLESKARKAGRNSSSTSYRDRLASLVDIMKTSPVPGSGFYDIGARSKRDGDYENDEFASSRAVHMPEFHNEIVMAPWVDSITALIKSRKRGPIYIGNSIAEYIRYERDMLSSKQFLEGDWKRFDSTLYARICIVAIGILRLFYHVDDIRADSFFLFIAHRLVLKDYYFPGGTIVRMIHGLPSGTKSTNLLGSIINLLCLNFCVECANVRKFSFAVGGDDFVIFCRDTISDDVIDEIIERSQALGMQFKFLDKKVTSSNKLEDYPYFYKYTVRDGKPFIKPADLLQRIFVPWNKRYNSSLKYFNFLEDQFPQLGYPNAALLPFYSIYCNMHRRLFKGVRISIGSVYQKHRILFEKYSSKIYHKSLNYSRDEIFTFLSDKNVSKLNGNSKILLGFYGDHFAYEIKF